MVYQLTFLKTVLRFQDEKDPRCTSSTSVLHQQLVPFLSKFEQVPLEAHYLIQFTQVKTCFIDQCIKHKQDSNLNHLDETRHRIELAVAR